jgi:SAM-dependent methyltransferase
MSVKASPRAGHSTDSHAPPPIDNEKDRLQALEQAYDPGTIRRLEELDLPSDANCLEVGAGAGSIARWMRRETDGLVVALDTDVVHLRDIPGIEAVEGDIRCWEVPLQFDLVHCRFLLDLLPAPIDTVTRLARATAPGGYLVLEEFDDLTAGLAFGTHEQVARHDQVVAAKQGAFAAADNNNYLGRHLPAMINATGAFRIRAAGHVEVRQGGAPGTEPWLRYLENQRASLSETGQIDQAGLYAYAHQLQDPSFLYFAPMLVSVVAEKL